VDHAEYAEPGPFTELTADQHALVQTLGDDPLAVCRAVQGLLVGPGDAAGAGLSDQRMSERNTRPARDLLARALELDASQLDHPRPPEARVVGTCRHYAVLATSFLRSAGVVARARCGFAAYFIPPRKVDHWIVEHWSDVGGRWTRTDPEWLDRETPVPARCDDLSPGDFLTAGEAWLLVRSGEEDATNFGVFGTGNWGAGEIRANAMRDLASLVAKVEMLPWDEWGPMFDSYENRTGDDFDLLIDRLAISVRDDDRSEMRRVHDQLAVPPSLIT
jgi:hypothetical protein